MLDPYLGWALPATVLGVRLCRSKAIDVVIVTIPYFSALIAGVLIARLCGAKLVIDYRDPMTVLERPWPRPFGKLISRAVERSAVRNANAIVFCTNIMKQEFIETFGAIAPLQMAVIYNGFLAFDSNPNATLGSDRTHMVYAGAFYGLRRLSIIAPVLAEMLHSGEISPENFRFHLYAQLASEDYELIRELGIRDLIEVHDMVTYDEVKRVMQAADILFLPSGDDVSYAVPYKFFDYLSVKRPILAVAPMHSAVHALMQSIDCGEFAVVGDSANIRRALASLIKPKRPYTFRGAERFLWEKAADQYIELINRTIGAVSNDPACRHRSERLSR